MREHDLVELARAHGLHVGDDGAVWGHVRALAALARALRHRENESCAQAVEAGEPCHGECAGLIRARFRA